MTETTARERSHATAIRCRGLVKRYSDVVAVDGLDLEVTAGECFGLLGPNGAGKTTTVEILEGLLAPDAGTVEILDLDWGEDARSIRARIGIQLQETRLSEKLTVEETLRIFRSLYPTGPSVNELLATVNLEEKRSARVGQLSGGQRQRLSVACALTGDPDLLFLDEPTTGLDPQSRRALWEMIERFLASGRTVLLTTHYMEEASRLCDRIAIMDRGRIIAAGTPADLVASLGADHVVEFALARDDGREPGREPGGQPDRDADGEPDRGRAAVDPAEALNVEVLGALPGVRAVRQMNGSVSLTVREVHSAIPALLNELARRDLALARLSTHHATLEDVFVDLTGRTLRDD